MKKKCIFLYLIFLGVFMSAQDNEAIIDFNAFFASLYHVRDYVLMVNHGVYSDEEEFALCELANVELCDLVGHISKALDMFVQQNGEIHPVYPLLEKIHAQTLNIQRDVFDTTKSDIVINKIDVLIELYIDLVRKYSKIQALTSHFTAEVRPWR